MNIRPVFSDCCFSHWQVQSWPKRLRRQPRRPSRRLSQRLNRLQSPLPELDRRLPSMPPPASSSTLICSSFKASPTMQPCAENRGARQDHESRPQFPKPPDTFAQASAQLKAAVTAKTSKPRPSSLSRPPAGSLVCRCRLLCRRGLCPASDYDGVKRNLEIFQAAVRPGADLESPRNSSATLTASGSSSG